MTFLNKLEIPIPLGVFELYDMEEIINSLTILITNNLNTNTWIFKIDNEFSGIIYLLRKRNCVF